MPVNALDLLIADHNRVRGLFARFTAAVDDGDVAAMSDLAATIAEELHVHTTIEEDVFYPAVHDTDDEIASTVDEGLEEHHVVDVLLAEIAELEPGSDQWIAKMTVVIENVEHHAEEEETELFPPLRNEMGTDRLESLGDQLESKKAALGAPTLADKIDLTVERLHEMAAHQEIPGRSSMNHDELAATVAPE
jgi:hemerythrin superfamily protein